jgi:hypothetical protein
MNVSFEDFPFIDIDSLEPGTEIQKIGSTSGVTKGYFIGVEEAQYVEDNAKHDVTGVFVQWLPGSAFTRPGDSGSIYYAVIIIIQIFTLPLYLF